MTVPNRRPDFGKDPRTLVGIGIFAGAVAIAALLSTGAEARSAAAPVNTSPPTISGTAVDGETLTASRGSWTGTPPISYTYQWVRCGAGGGLPDASDCPEISGATTQTYDVVGGPGGDIGSTLRVVEKATSGSESATAVSAPTAVVTEVTNPVNTAEPVISGSPVEGSTLSTSNGMWTGTGIDFTYQWVRCDAGGGLPDGSDCPTIPGATNPSYTLVAEDIGHRFRAQVTADNSAPGSATAVSNPTDVVTQSTTSGPPRNTVEPSISGTPAVGSVLSANRGTWAGETLTFEQQWVRCGADGGLPDGTKCEPISGATTTSYIPTSADVGQRLRFRVKATNSLGVQTVASNATSPVQSSTTTTQTAPRNTLLPTILGSATVGGTLTASVGLWSGATPIAYAYAWQRCDADGSGCVAIAGAAATQYVAAADDLSRRLRVQITARNTLGTATATSNATAQVQAAGSGSTPPPSPNPPANLPPGAVRLQAGMYSVPVTSVSSPERLVAGSFAFLPGTVRSTERPLVLRVRVLDTRGYAVRDALVFVRSTPLVTSSPSEVRSGRDGWARISLTPRADFPLNGKSVQFMIRVRKQSDPLLAGVSNRRLVQVSTAG